jgi:hypothetical protein
MADVDTQVLAKLKAARPDRVRAYDRDGDARDIAVSKGSRKKWHAVQAVLADLAWTRLELLDPKGSLVGVVDRPDDAGDLEDLQPDREVAKASGLLALMLRAQEVALNAQHRGIAKALDTNTELLRLVATRLEVMERQAVQHLEQQQSLAREMVDQMLDAAATAAAGGGGDEEGQSGRAIIGVLPAVIKALKGGDGKEPTKEQASSRPPSGARSIRSRAARARAAGNGAEVKP